MQTFEGTFWSEELEPRTVLLAGPCNYFEVRTILNSKSSQSTLTSGQEHEYVDGNILNTKTRHADIQHNAINLS